MGERLTVDERRLVQKTIREANEQGWGIALGLMCGLGLFVATNLLLLKGGSTIGAHLGLLGVYFPGYRVTFLGSLIGFVYAFVIGYGAGRTIVTIYNRLTVGMR